MSRLKRREPFGKAGLTVAMIALVMALVGGAYAATKLNSTQKKEVEKIAKKYAGKPGANGAQGPAGNNGAPGKDGANGTSGSNGSDGVSAEAISFSGAQHGCAEGGIEVKSAKPVAYVCNGEEGSAGNDGVDAKATSFSGNEHGCIEGGVKVESAEPTVYVCNGSPWAAGGTLPSGKTETGTWATAALPVKFESQETVMASLSFPIPLAAGMENEEECDEAGHSACLIHVINEGEADPAGCMGSVSSPEAAPGNLCLFALLERNVRNVLVGTGFPFQALNSGATLTIHAETAGEKLVSSGTWAVTAP